MPRAQSRPLSPACADPCARAGLHASATRPVAVLLFTSAAYTAENNPASLMPPILPAAYTAENFKRQTLYEWLDLPVAYTAENLPAAYTAETTERSYIIAKREPSTQVRLYVLQ